MSDIVINLVFEDSLSGAVLRKLLLNAKQDYAIGFSHNSGGFGWIRKRIEGFNNAAKGMPYLILTDLDRSECPPSLLREWHIENHNHNLLFNVAVRQVESWILACRCRFAEFIGIQESLIPANVDEIPDAKRFLIDLAKRSRKRELREDIVPKDGSTARIGADYNGRLIRFIESRWDPNIARKLSPSLRRIMESLDAFQPIFQNRE
ncbi:MAG: hypothetical protein JXM79_07905 [Sedimentisphaerales bacterium]|nr:hypothetical protein [Sedimentisphaerales bacterium]